VGSWVLLHDRDNMAWLCQCFMVQAPGLASSTVDQGKDSCSQGRLCCTGHIAVQVLSTSWPWHKQRQAHRLRCQAQQGARDKETNTTIRLSIENNKNITAVRPSALLCLEALVFVHDQR
jgi:hypothetical protein